MRDGQDWRQVNVDAIVRLARVCADELLAEAADPTAVLTGAERRRLLAIAAAVDREVTLRAGIEPRSAEAQAVIDASLRAALPKG